MVKIRQKQLDTGANRFIETPTWKMLTRQSGNVAKQKIIIKKTEKLSKTQLRNEQSDY